MALAGRSDGPLGRLRVLARRPHQPFVPAYEFKGSLRQVPTRERGRHSWLAQGARRTAGTELCPPGPAAGVRPEDLETSDYPAVSRPSSRAIAPGCGVSTSRPAARSASYQQRQRVGIQQKRACPLRHHLLQDLQRLRARARPRPSQHCQFAQQQRGQGAKVRALHHQVCKHSRKLVAEMTQGPLVADRGHLATGAGAGPAETRLLTVARVRILCRDGCPRSRGSKGWI